MGDLWLPPSAQAKRLRFCECCHDRPGETAVTFIVGGHFENGHAPTKNVRVVLCVHCKQGGDDLSAGNIPSARHSGGFCTICGKDGGIVWTCQRITHVREKHPHLMERLIRDPFEEIAAVPQGERLGTIEVEVRPEDSPKRWF